MKDLLLKDALLYLDPAISVIEVKLADGSPDGVKHISDSTAYREVEPYLDCAVKMITSATGGYGLTVIIYPLGYEEGKA